MKKITALFSIALLIFSASASLFAGGKHECVKESRDHRMTPVKKMSCCPVEQETNSCNCAEMSRHNNEPKETSPVVLLTTDNANFGKYITLQFDLIDPQFQLQQYFNSCDMDPGIADQSNRYKLLHTFLI